MKRMTHFETKYFRKALDRHVLAVAVCQYTNEELFDWAVYVGAVEGKNHDNEFIKVAETGSKARKEEAVVYFPYIDSEKYRR